MTLLQETKEAFANVRSSVVVAMQRLAAVKAQDAWTAVAATWGEYVESELGISQGFSSKLLSVNNHYLVEGGFSPDKLEGVDYEKLNMARFLSGSVEEQLAKARTLTRVELKAEKNDEQPHVHEWIEICRSCSIRNHAPEV